MDRCRGRAQDFEEGWENPSQDACAHVQCRVMMCWGEVCLDAVVSLFSRMCAALSTNTAPQLLLNIN